MNKGSVPPSFTLKDQDGKNVGLSKFKGKPVVVYFYPADESPSCTKQVTVLKSLLHFSFNFIFSVVKANVNGRDRKWVGLDFSNEISTCTPASNHS